MELGEVLAAPRPMQGQYAQAGREALGFVQPVGYEAGWHDRQGRCTQAPGLLLQQQMGQGLQGLAQAHVVAEDAAGTHFAQGLQPVQALLLIGAQAGLQPGGRFYLQVAGIAQAAAQIAYMLATFPVQGQAFDFVQARGVGALHAQGRACRVLVQVELAQGAHDCLDAAVGQGDAQGGGIGTAAVEVDQQVLIVTAPGQFARA